MAHARRKRPRKRNGIGHDPPSNHVTRAAFDNRGILEVILYIGGRNYVLNLGGWLAAPEGKAAVYAGGSASLVPVLKGQDPQVAFFTTGDFASTYAGIAGRVPDKNEDGPPDTITHLGVDGDHVIEIGLWIRGVFWLMQFGMIFKPSGKRPAFVSDVVGLRPVVEGEDWTHAQFKLADLETHYRNVTGRKILLPDGVQA